MEEIWKDVEGYEGTYEISNLGNIRSLFYRNQLAKNKKIRYLKPYLNKGYFMITLVKDNKRLLTSIHRLIAQAFIPNLKNRPCINHINGIKTDNRIENLEWVTHKANMKHAVYVLGKCNRFKTRKIICNDNMIFNSITEASKKLGIRYGSLYRVLDKKRNSVHGYTFKYFDNISYVPNKKEVK